MKKIITDLDKLAKKIIEKNQYVSIASTDKAGNPWISPVVYSYDDNWNLYFVSMPTSKHCKNIKNNKDVAIAIFDSHQKSGEGVGLQIEAKIELVKPNDLLSVAKISATRKYPCGGLDFKGTMNFIKSMILKGKKYRIYKIILKTVWMNNPNSKTDVRVKININ